MFSQAEQEPVLQAWYLMTLELQHETNFNKILSNLIMITAHDHSFSHLNIRHIFFLFIIHWVRKIFFFVQKVLLTSYTKTMFKPNMCKPQYLFSLTDVYVHITLGLQSLTIKKNQQCTFSISISIRKLISYFFALHQSICFYMNSLIKSSAQMHLVQSKERSRRHQYNLCSFHSWNWKIIKPYLINVLYATGF